MANNQNPWDIPGWGALHREVSLVRQLIGSGATSLGKANYADKTGEYYNAFFGLSVGLERLAKLIMVADHAISTGGRLPDQGTIRKFGHEISKLLDKADAIAKCHKLSLDYHRPTDAIASKVIECLDAFADAKRGRYANFAALGDPHLEAEFEPIRKWWNEVAELILEEHCVGKAVEKRVHDNAGIVDALMSEHASVLYINETGEVMQDLLSASIRTGQTKIVQRFGRYYALTIVRWLSDVFSKLTHQACYHHKMHAFFGHSEFFSGFRVEDQYLKSRKIWPAH